MEPSRYVQNKLSCNDEIPVIKLVQFIWRYKIPIVLFVALVTATAGIYESIRPQKYIARCYCEKSFRVPVDFPITLADVNLIAHSARFQKELGKALNENKITHYTPVFIRYLPSEQRLLLQTKAPESESASKVLQIWTNTIYQYMRQLVGDIIITQIKKEMQDIEIKLGSIDASQQVIATKKIELNATNTSYSPFYLQSLVSLELQQQIEKEYHKKKIEDKSLLLKALYELLRSQSNFVEYPDQDKKTIDTARALIEQNMPVEFTKIEVVQEPRRVLLVSLLAFLVSCGGICLLMVGIFGIVSQKADIS
jgi:LPS O-antigen subunit length determinant protein (WzzB/FepE family)